MKTKEEIMKYINDFIQNQTKEMINLQDNIMLHSSLESGDIDYRMCYKHLASFREKYQESLSDFVKNVPIVDVKNIEKNLEYTLEAAQDLRYSNTTNPIVDIEVQKMVDSIFDDIYNIRKELEII